MGRWIAVGLGVMIAAAPSVAWAEGCFPECRAGFMCHDGQCISRCNPPCASGEQCTDAGACEAVAPTQPTGADPQPDAAQQPTPVLAPQPAVVAQPTVMAVPATTQPVQLQQNAGAEAALAERARLRAIRTRFRVGAYVGVGWTNLDSQSDDEGKEYSLGTYGVSAGLMLRHNPAYILGYQLRLGFMASGGSGDGRGDDERGLFYGPASGGIFQLDIDFAFKIGPFAQAFPMYIDLGGFMTTAFSWATVTGQPDSDDRDRQVDLSRTDVMFGTTGGLGFIFGADEQFDMGARVNWALSEPMQPRATLVFTWAFM